ncbi:MAG: PucR family transcriptional regulator [Christensenellales bacterium]
MDEALLGSIQDLFASLGRDLRLLDLRGQSLAPAGPTAFYLPLDMAPGETATQSGCLFRRLRSPEPLYLVCAEGAGATDLLSLAAFGLENLLQAQPAGEDRRGAWRRLLGGEMDPKELEALVSAHHITAALPRQVLALSLPKAKSPDAFSLLEALVPLEEDDVLLPLDRSLVALIKPLAGQTGQDEIKEFARALQETLREETGFDLRCGVGEPAADAGGLHRSCRQALRAMEIGEAFTPKEGLWVYSEMLFPRFLWDVAPEAAGYYHALIFNKRSAHLFTQEMIDTIAMFLEKDLNLADTARQLYIHRNTLVYRLDKVHRLSGLDVRRFDDALIFKLFYDLRKCRKLPADAHNDPRKASK